MPPPTPAQLLALAQERVPLFLDDLTQVCAIDSGSYDRDGVNAMVDWCGERFAKADLAVERVGHQPVAGGTPLGDLLIGRRTGRRLADAGGRRLLLLAHCDTVYEAGTAAARPVRIDGDRVIGPGVTDDKGGLLTGLHALELLDAAGWTEHAGVVFTCSPDEELGSPFSRPYLEDLARQSDAGFCLECGRENGDIVSSRKGIVELIVDIVGRAAHAGVEPERGHSAALEAAHKTVEMQALNGRWPGVTVNVGVLRSGTRPNMVAERAELHVDVRATHREELDEALRAVDAIVERSWVAGTVATSRRGATHAPMEPTPQIAALVDVVRAVAGELGFAVDAASTGGAADANTVAAVGLPVIDGLGPIGGDDHSPDEWLALSSIAPRMALLAGVLARVGAGDGPIGG
ncbi:MAG: M20 family metallopeptidase [Frankiaceae bacterium]